MLAFRTSTEIVCAKKHAGETSDVDRRDRILKTLRVAPGTKADLAGRDTRWSGGGEFDQLSSDELDATAKEILAKGVERLEAAQELLWASDSYALLLVFQAMDAAGKDSTIKHVMSGVNPQGVHVVSFRRTVERGARPRLPVAHLEGAARAGTDRHLQPLALRGGRRAPGAPRVARRSAPAHERSRAPLLGRALRGHQRVRTPPRQHRHQDRQVLPPRLEGRAEAPVHRSARQSRQDCGSSTPTTSPNAHGGTTTWTRSKHAITATSTDWAPWFVIPADRKHVMQAMVAVDRRRHHRIARSSVADRVGRRTQKPTRKRDARSEAEVDNARTADRQAAS